MKRNRLTAAAVSIFLVAGILCGCGKEDGSDNMLPDVNPGRYVEEEVEWLEAWNGWTVKQLFTEEEKLHLLLTKEKDECLMLQEWEKDGDSFSEVTGKWMNTVFLPAQSWMNLKLMKDGNGVQYLFAGYAEEDIYKCHLWRSDGDSVLDITPEEWTVPDEEWGCYEYISGITALDNGTLVANGSRTVDILYGEDGSVLDSEQTEGDYDENVLSDGEDIYLFSADYSGAITEIEKRPGGKRENVERIPFGQNSSAGVMLCVTKSGTLISAGADGIYRCEAGREDWEKLMSGSETDFSLSGCWCTGLTALENGIIYAAFAREDGTAKLIKYEYDPDAVTRVTETLKLYAVKESFLLQNAVALYHREHPEVAIEVEYGYTYNDMYSDKIPDYTEIYQKLNTMLMSDEAPDILVLDHLDADSFWEKRLLVDVNDVVGPMEENGELLKGITGSYLQEDGTRYTVPLQFAFTYITGRDCTVENMTSLESLAEFLREKNESYLGPQTVEELVDKFYPYFCGDIVNDKKLDKEVLRDKLEALKEIADNSGIVTQHDDSNGRNGHCFNMWDLASRTKLALDKADGFNGCMFAVAITDYIKGEFTAFENSFTPMIQMGICAKSSHQDTAKDFLKFVLSEKVQGTDYYEGFPVNTSCLVALAAADRSDAAASTTITTEDGGEVEFNIMPYSRETAQKLLDICNGLNKPVVEDAKIREVMIESLGGYLSGSENVEEVLDKMEAGLKMYLAE